MEAVTISSTYRVVIPKEIRKQFNLKPGDKLMFIPRDSTLEVAIIPSTREAKGSLKGTKTEGMREEEDEQR